METIQLQQFKVGVSPVAQEDLITRSIAAAVGTRRGGVPR